jgi:hypothetical protein
MGNMTKNDPFAAHAAMPHPTPSAIGLCSLEERCTQLTPRGLVLKRLSYRNLHGGSGPPLNVNPAGSSNQQVIERRANVDPVP